MEPTCTCPLRVKHVGPNYSGRVLKHVEGCDWAVWFETVDKRAHALGEQRRAAGALGRVAWGLPEGSKNAVLMATITSHDGTSDEPNDAVMMPFIQPVEEPGAISPDDWEHRMATLGKGPIQERQERRPKGRK